MIIININGNSNYLLKRRIFVPVLLSCAPFAVPAYAQDTSMASVPADDIVVTAQRREQKLQDVGIAVAAFGGQALRTEGIANSTEVARLIPGVTISGTYGGQSTQFSIRGVTQSDFNDAIEAPVAVYIDDTYIASQQGQSMALFDVERVEALKGPQGTLFGRNATGGLVHFIVNKPVLNQTTGFVEATYGRFNTRIIEAAVNLPLTETVAVRVSGIWDRNGSVWKNIFPGGLAAGAPVNFGPAGVSPAGENLGGKDTLSGRAQLLFEPSSGLRFRLSGSATRQHFSESPWVSVAALPVVDAQNRIIGTGLASPTETRAAIGPGGANYFNPAQFPFQQFLFSPTTPGFRAPGATYFGYTPVDIGKREISKDYALGDLNRFKAYNAALHIDAELGDVDLVSVTSYSKYKKSFLLDADASPVNAFAFGNRADIETVSQELRLSGQSAAFSWTAGVYYLDIDAQNAQGILAPKGSAFSTFFGAEAAGVDPLAVFRLKTRSSSVFGQISYEFAPRLTFIVGGRFINEHQKYDYYTTIAQNLDDYAVDIGPGPAIYPPFNDKRTKSLWAAKAQAEYRPNDSLLLYLGINRGVKGGSYNGQYFEGSPPLAPSEIPYDAETLVSTEGGFKLTGPGGSYTLNASVFHYHYSGYQSYMFSNLAGVVENLPARTNGAEIEATLRISDSLRAGVMGSYVDATVKDFQIAPGVIRDTRPAYTPKYSGSARLNYTIPGDIFDGRLGFGAVLTYQSGFYHNARNFTGDRIAGRTLVDVNANWSFQNGVSLGGFIKNLFDKRYANVGLDLSTACGCNLIAYGQPLTWGLKAGYRF